MIRRFNRQSRLGHLVSPGIITLVHFLDDLRVFGRNIGRFARVGFDVIQPPLFFLAELYDPPLLPPGRPRCISMPEQRIIRVGFLFAPQQRQQVSTSPT